VENSSGELTMYFLPSPVSFAASAAHHAPFLFRRLSGEACAGYLARRSPAILEIGALPADVI